MKLSDINFDFKGKFNCTIDNSIISSLGRTVNIENISGELIGLGYDFKNTDSCENFFVTFGEVEEDVIFKFKDETFLVTQLNENVIEFKGGISNYYLTRISS